MNSYSKLKFHFNIIIACKINVLIILFLLFLIYYSNNINTHIILIELPQLMEIVTFMHN